MNNTVINVSDKSPIGGPPTSTKNYSNVCNGLNLFGITTGLVYKPWTNQDIPWKVKVERQNYRARHAGERSLQ
jgi:hypothetical protein